MIQVGTRRGFLKDTVAVVAAGLGGQVLAAAERRGPATRPKWVIACRDVHLSQTGEPDCWAAMKSIGVEGVEVSVEMSGDCPALFHPSEKYTIGTAEGIKLLKNRLGAEGREITAFCLHNRFDEYPEQERAFVAKVAQAADELGVPAVRLDVVPRKLADKEEQFLQFAAGMGRDLVRDTAGTRVRFGVENHGNTTNRPEFLRKLFEAVGSRRFGLTLDTGNFYWFGHPLSRLYDLYEEFAASSCHTHCKSINYPPAQREKQRPTGWEYGKYACPIDQGDIDFKRVVAILGKHGYTGDLCIENESLNHFAAGQRPAVLRREAELLRKLSTA